MREFMTKVSDYFNERRNHPERQEDRLAVVIIGVAAAVVIVLLLLVLWGHIVQERRQKEKKDLEAATYEEKVPEYMSQNDGQEELRQEYLASAEYLNDKVAELLAAMTQVEQNLSETIEQYQEEDASQQEELASLYTEVSSIVYNLKETQMILYDLTDIVQVMNEETIPMIREQIIQIQADIDQIHLDIANLYTKVAALEQEDMKLWESIGDVEEELQAALNRNMTEVNNQFEMLLNQIEAAENRIGRLVTNTLQYRYDPKENTLYLEPYKE